VSGIDRSLFQSASKSLLLEGLSMETSPWQTMWAILHSSSATSMSCLVGSSTMPTSKQLPMSEKTDTISSTADGRSSLFGVSRIATSIALGGNVLLRSPGPCRLIRTRRQRSPWPSGAGLYHGIPPLRNRKNLPICDLYCHHPKIIILSYIWDLNLYLP
jgi:hypothetical protein